MKTNYPGFSKTPDSGFLRSDMIPRDVNVLTKERYDDMVMRQRRDFVHRNFSSELNILFEMLREDSAKMKECKREFRVDLPIHFDIYKIGAILCLYFVDLGYTPMIETQDSESRCIFMTIT